MTYFYDCVFHRLPASIECKSLEEAIGLAIADMEYGDAWPAAIRDESATLWQAPSSPFHVGGSLDAFAKLHR